LVVLAGRDACDRFMAYSRLKYGGLMDAWLKQVELAIDRCTSCGHYWYRQQPDSAELLAMYDAGRPLKPENLPSREPTVIMMKEMCRLHRVAGGETDLSLLDYGSGFGRWARAATLVGFRVTAYEPSHRRGQEEGGVGFLWESNLQSLSGRTFDVINIEQVLEHVPDPLEVMTSIRKMCSSRTLVRVTVPNIDRCSERGRIWEVWPFDGTKPHTMAPFEHLHGFTYRSLRRLALNAGFSPLPASRCWREYPISTARALLGSVLPRFGQTFLILRPTFL
jgi:SAM-dependent methyltransferase